MRRNRPAGKARHWCVRNVGLMQLLSLSLVTAGEIGNLLDRLFNHGAAIDYVRLGIGLLRTGMFNIATEMSAE